MTHEQYERKLKALEIEYDTKKKEVMLDYAKSHNPYVVGDIVTDHIGSIKVEKIQYSLYNLVGTPCAVYDGVELKKDGTPNKKGKTRKVWQSNIKQN